MKCTLAIKLYTSYQSKILLIQLIINKTHKYFLCCRKMRLLLFLGLATAVQSIETGWRPIPGPGSGLGPSPTPFGPTPHGPSPLIPRTLGFNSRFPHIHQHHHNQHSRPNPPVCTLYKATFDQDTFQQVCITISTQNLQH